MPPLNVVILAAGLGKRMHSRLPKVLHRLAGRPLLEHVLQTARVLSPDKVCVVYGHGGEQVLQALRNAGAVFVKQEPQLGTGHALAQALPHLERQGSTLVLYGDVPLIRPETLKRLIALSGPERLALLSVELEDPTGYGRILRDAEGRILRIVEDKDASAEERAVREVNTGILVAPVKRLAAWLDRLDNDNAQGEYYLTDIIEVAAAEGVEVVAVQPSAPWEVLGVNSKAELARLERCYQQGQARRLLEQGVTLADPARIDVRGELACGCDVSIDIGCVFEGRVELADGARVGAYCILKNARVKEGAEIAPYTLIEDAEIGAFCRVGPYARIRPGTRLAAEVHIGNFVEVKNSEIGAGSKANHLSYVGDSVVGKDVNIGAGTITCNYDGANKHRTVIEDGAFIGSDTQLVAPVTVGRGATIGAGSTIVKDAPPGELTLSRARQVSVPGWKRPVKKKG